jgi:hypothetical protein
MAEWRRSACSSVDAVTSSEKKSPLSPRASNGFINIKQALGNAFLRREVHGQDLINLVVYWMVSSKAYLDKVPAYVHNCNPGNPLYSQSQIHHAELQLGLFWKDASTTFT